MECLIKAETLTSSQAPKFACGASKFVMMIMTMMMMMMMLNMIIKMIPPLTLAALSEPLQCAQNSQQCKLEP